MIGNIRTLARLRRESGRARPKLILSFVRQQDSDDERAFIQEWSGVADKVLRRCPGGSRSGEHHLQLLRRA